MNYLKLLGVAAAALIASAWLGVGAAVATELYSGAATQGVNTEVRLSLASGTSSLLETTDGLTVVDTCTIANLEAKIKNPGGKSSEGKHPRGEITALTFGGCSHKTTVLSKGSIEFRDVGSTNATVHIDGTEVTVLSTVFGVSCILNTGGGVAMGTLNGITSGNASVNFKAIIPSGFLCGGDLRWTALSTVTAPTGLNSEAQ